MAEPYVGEIRIFAGTFAPAGWMTCDGQLLPISENETLFNLIGTTYGGDGETTFALPDLRGRLPVHQGSGFTLAETGGVEAVTLTVNQIPAHTHALVASNAGASSTSPTNRAISQPNKNMFRAGPGTVAFAPQSVASAGGSQPHENIQPCLCLNFIISLFGIFPSPS